MSENLNQPNRAQPRNHQEEVHALFIQHSSALRGFIIAIMPDFSRVDDVFQETFLTVSRKAADFKLDTNFLGWACSIAPIADESLLLFFAYYLSTLLSANKH